MKTLLLKKQELDKLPAETQNQILNIVKERENSIDFLKKRIKNLETNSVTYREDINQIRKLDKENNLTFDIYRKTEGEQWGNCEGNRYVIRIGSKYIRIDREHYITNSTDWDTSFYISINKLSEILDLLEEAEKSNEVDKDKMYIIACHRVDALYNPY